VAKVGIPSATEPERVSDATVVEQQA
jgi:hypothetical protein